MNPLQQLKDRLQTVLNESTEHKDFIEALEDCVYACNLGVTALEQHLDIWSTVSPVDSKYRKGIEFVESEWHQITGMF
jgi:hypothetical protein